MDAMEVSGASGPARTFPPSENPHAPAGMIATRTEADTQNLESLVGRIVFKYFEGYGNFLGMVKSKVPSRPVVAVEYEDGDAEELYLDQLLDALMPTGTLPPAGESDPDATKYGYVWPPPTTSSRLLVNTVRTRKPSAYALEQQRLAQLRELAAAQAKAAKLERGKERERLKREKAEAKKKAAELKAKGVSSTSTSKLKGTLAPKKTAVAAKKNSGTKKKAAGATKKTSTKAKAKPPNLSNTGASAEPLERDNQLATSSSPKREQGARSGRAEKRRRIREWKKCTECNRKHWSDAACPTVDDDNRDDDQVASAAAPKRWMGNTTAALLMSLKAKFSLDQDTSSPTQATAETPEVDVNPLSVLVDAAEGTSPALMADLPIVGSGSNGASAEEAFRSHPTEVDEGLGPPMPAMSESVALQGSPHKSHPDVVLAYSIIKSKVDITSGGDGYGMTGNCTQASMGKLFEVLQDKCELGSDSWFMDLGHGMGRPTIHAALLRPRIAGAFGTEFNPALYKQSMLALSECTSRVDVLSEAARVFFMDVNIKDFGSLNPFSHVYSFQIGMPEDVVDHIFKLISQSTSVKYAILFPHRTVTSKRLNEIGDIVHAQRMAMPGGRSYEVNVVKIRRTPGAASTDDAGAATAPPTASAKRSEEVDSAVVNALEVLRDKRLYDEYLEQLGLVAALENEQNRIMSSRGQRRLVTNTRFLEQSPCLPDINYGFIRRVAVQLGVSTSGTKVQILANIQQYVPVTFGLSMLAIGDQYTDATVQRVVDKLLAVPPSRRQPEAMHI